MVTTLTRQEYEREINRLQKEITDAQKELEAKIRKKDNNQGSHCAGIKGYGACEQWKRARLKEDLPQIDLASQHLEKQKQNLWDYQKRIAKEEQEAQVEAVRQAIADQVRLEQERIQQSQQNQIIMQQAPPAEPEPTASSEKITLMSEKITPMSEKITPFELPFNENYLLPIIAIGGYLVLRN